MDKLLKFFYNSALDLRLPVKYTPEIDCMQISLGKKNYLFYGTVTPFNNFSSIYLSQDKPATLHILNKTGIPIPLSAIIHEEIYPKQPLEDLIKGLSFPLVLKPAINTYGGEGVVCNIKDIKSLRNHLDASIDKYLVIHIEEFISGLKEYRILIFKNRILGVVRRYPLSVIGDGTQSIAQLFVQWQSQQEQDRALAQIDLQCLSDQGLTTASIPKKGDIIRLNNVLNHARGGSVRTLTQKIPAANRRILIGIAKKLNLELVGLDILCEDIYKSLNHSKWFFLEANYDPAIDVHEAPEMGEKIFVGKTILRQLIYRHPFAYLKHRLSVLKNKPDARGIDG